MECRSDLPIFRLQIEDTNGNMVVHHIDSAPGDQISVEVVSDDLPNDELVSDSIMDSDVVARDQPRKPGFLSRLRQGKTLVTAGHMTLENPQNMGGN